MTEERSGLILNPSWLIEIQQKTQLPAELIERTRRILMSELEPTGMCSTSVYEIIQSQLHEIANDKYSDEREIAQTLLSKLDIIEHELNEIISYKDINLESLTDDQKQLVGLLKNVLKLPCLEVQDVLSEYHYVPSARVIAKVLEDKNTKKLHLQYLEDEFLPEVYIDSELFESIIQSNDSSEEFREQAIEFKTRAEDLISLCNERISTLHKLCNYLFDNQEQYFNSGNLSDIAPIVQKELAEYLDRDRSSVSRLLKNKFIDTPYGTIPLRRLATVETETKENILLNSIESEDKKNPYTDEQLAQIVREETGTKRFGRTAVVNMRKALNIPKRSERRNEN